MEYGPGRGGLARQHLATSRVDHLGSAPHVILTRQKAGPPKGQAQRGEVRQGQKASWSPPWIRVGDLLDTHVGARGSPAELVSVLAIVPVATHSAYERR